MQLCIRTTVLAGTCTSRTVGVRTHAEEVGGLSGLRRSLGHQDHLLGLASPSPGAITANGK